MLENEQVELRRRQCFRLIAGLPPAILRAGNN
jgi:hypothetical protein